MWPFHSERRYTMSEIAEIAKTLRGLGKNNPLEAPPEPKASSAMDTFMQLIMGGMAKNGSLDLSALVAKLPPDQQAAVQGLLSKGAKP